MKVVVLAGSNIGSKTKIIANKVNELLQVKENLEITVLNLKELQVDMSDGRNYLDYKGDTLQVTTSIMAAEAIIIATPVFQASIPAALKNIFDLLPKDALKNKVVGIVLLSGSSKHFLVAEMHLKPILSYMKAQIVSTYVFAQDGDFFQGEIVGGDVLIRLQQLVDDTIMLTEAYQAALQKQEESFGF